MKKANIEKVRSSFRMRAGLLRTIYWGMLETTILPIIWWIDTHIWSNFHTRFMRLLHGRMGGIVTPSIIELEDSHSKRNWENRSEFELIHMKEKKNRPKGVFLKKMMWLFFLHKKLLI